MNRFLNTTLAASALALMTALPLTAQESQVSGTVAEVFGTQVILATGGERLLVTLPEGSALPSQGAEVTVTGLREGATLNATALSLGAGAAAQAPETAAETASDADLPPELRGLGLTDVRSHRDDDEVYYYARLPGGGWLRAETDRGRLEEVQSDGVDLPAALVAALLPQNLRDEPRMAQIARLTEIELDDDGEITVEGYAEDGMRIEIEFDRNGRVTDYERERDGRRSLPETEARARLEALGYTSIGFVERRGRHVEALALNPYGEEVEVRLDDQGRVDRERMWPR